MLTTKKQIRNSLIPRKIKPNTIDNPNKHKRNTVPFWINIKNKSLNLKGITSLFKSVEYNYPSNII